LLGWRRHELGEVVAAAALCAIDDPSNSDGRYDRARIRARLSETEWLNPEPLARSAAALAQAAEALEWVTDRVLQDRVERRGEAYQVDAAHLPAEIVRRILVRILTRNGSPPRRQDVLSLTASLHDGKTATLGGYRCSGGRVWRFDPEGPRAQPSGATKA
jgi:tRNA(Ile)-lysidine synthase